MTCVHYAGNQFCKLYNSKVASAYCGDICDVKEKVNEDDQSDNQITNNEGC